MTKEIPVYSSDVCDYLAGHSEARTNESLSFWAEPAVTHTYIEPTHGTDTGMIDYTRSEPRLIGHIIAPDDARVAMSNGGLPRLYNGPNDKAGYWPDEAIAVAECGGDRMRWRPAS